jgi:hypothetical protein
MLSANERRVRRGVSHFVPFKAGEFAISSHYPVLAPVGTRPRHRELAKSGIIGCNRVWDRISRRDPYEGTSIRYRPRLGQTHRGNR